MDIDALSAMVCGELYVPLDVVSARKAVTFTRSWRFPVEDAAAVAAYAARFHAPFWAELEVDGDTRVSRRTDGTTVTETLTDSSDTSYDYTEAGLPNVEDAVAAFAVTSDPEGATLTWTSTFTPLTRAATVSAFSYKATVAAAIESALEGQFPAT
jgi:hypothetical protein